MTERTLEEITADIAVIIDQQQSRMQYMTPDDDTRYLLEAGEIPPALLAELGRALAFREIENMVQAYCLRLVAAGKARKHANGRSYYRRHDGDRGRSPATRASA